MIAPPKYAKAAWKTTENIVDNFKLGRFIIIGSIEGLLAVYLAAIIQFISKPFTIFSYWVSNLGANNTPYIFNIGLFISGILLAIFVLAANIKFRREFRKKKPIIITTIIMGTISVTGISMLTINDMFNGSVIHTIGAYMFFFSSLALVIFSTYQLSTVIQLSKTMKIVVILDILFYIGMGFSIVILSFYVDGNVIKTMLSSMDPMFAMVRFFEWLVVTTFLIWLFVAGLEIQRSELKSYYR